MNNSTSNICPQFGRCGGCQKQDIPYAGQLAYKQTYITNLLSQFHPGEIHDIVPSPQVWHFRNKMEFAVSGTVDAPHVGLRPQEKFSEVIDITECRIFYPQVNAVLETVRQWIRGSRVEPYNFRRQTGCLRYISMRHSKFYGHIMVILVVAMDRDGFAAQKDTFSGIVQRLSAVDGVSSVYACLNPGRSDEALGGELVLLHGNAHIQEQINGIDYRISPRSFFQTNSSCCNKLYDIISSLARSEGSAVLDLFCGCGGISLQVCRSASRVTGIDIVGQNIEDARENCRANAVSNVTFVTQDAGQFLEEAAVSGVLQEYSVLIVDPPRQGLTKKGRAVIVDSGIERVVYVSCNPWNLVQDLKILLPAYRLEAVYPVDMFPHTPHMETVVRLARQ